MERIAVIVLAAGKGTRMKSALPKVITKTLDKPLICHALSSVQSLRPKLVAVVTGHGASLVEEAVEAALQGGDLTFNEVAFPRQEEQLGTAHAAASALPALEGFEGTVLILCGDTPLLSTGTLTSMLEKHHQTRSTVTLLSAIVSDPGGYGRIIRDSSGERVLKITEFKDCSSTERLIREINTGVYAVDAHFLRTALSAIRNQNAQGEYYLTDIVEVAMAQQKTVSALPVVDPDEWLGVNTYADLQRVNELILRRRLDWFMREGVNIPDPRSVFIGEKVLIEPGVFIGPNTQLLGKTTLRHGCYIEGSCYLRDTEVGEGAVIKFSVRAEGAVVGKGASVGPFAHLRPGSLLGESVKVGNFVETKNAELGPKASAGHLSYLGDCTIGERVNIGAGTITCNYDGFAKHRTVIEEDCFIGSDSCLIAPLTIGRGSTVGAGSVISSDVPPYTLALTRAPLKVREGYVRKAREKGS